MMLGIIRCIMKEGNTVIVIGKDVIKGVVKTQRGVQGIVGTFKSHTLINYQYSCLTPLPQADEIKMKNPNNPIQPTPKSNAADLRCYASG